MEELLRIYHFIFWQLLCSLSTLLSQGQGPCNPCCPALWLHFQHPAVGGACVQEGLHTSRKCLKPCVLSRPRLKINFFFFCLNTKNLQDSLQRFMLADLYSGKNQPWGVVEKGFMCLSIRRKKSLLMAAGRIQASRPPGLRAL